MVIGSLASPCLFSLRLLIAPSAETKLLLWLEAVLERVELIGDFLEGGLQGAYLVYRQHGGVLRQVLFRRRQRHRHSIQRLRERQLLPNTILISGRALFRLQGDGMLQWRFSSTNRSLVLTKSSHLYLGHLGLQSVPHLLRLSNDGVRPELSLVRIV